MVEYGGLLLVSKLYNCIRRIVFMAQKRKRSKKWIYWVLLLVLLVAAGVVAYLVWDGYFRDKSGESDAPRASEVVGWAEEKKEMKEDGKEIENDDEEEDDKKVKQYDGEDPNKAEKLSGVVTYAGVLNGRLTIRLNIDQYLEEGKCELNLVKDGSTVYTETSGIVSAATTATCEGFDVSMSGFGAGKYSVVVKLDAGGRTGTIKGEVEI